MFYFYLPALLSLAAALRPTTESTQFAYLQQQRDAQNLWDHIDLHKVEKQLTSWNNEPTIASPEQPAAVGEARQGYPDIPRPIPPIQVLPTSPPEPIVPPQGCLATRGQFPSPTSCAHYLNCWDDVVIEQQCPGGLLFNEVTGTCDFEYNTYCAGRPGPPPKPELPPGSTVCPDPNGRYRSSTNCSEFFFCVYGKPVKYGCPRGLVYNEELAVCDYPFRVDCRGAAVPDPWTPTQPQRPQPTQPPTDPYYPSQQPQQPSYPPQYIPQQPQEPQYPQYPQQPQYTEQPSYAPNTNPWLTGPRTKPDPWHQRPVATQIELQEEKDKNIKEQQQQLLQQLGQLSVDVRPITAQQDAEQKFLNADPWGEVLAIPAELTKVPCNDGDVHRLTESCSRVVVCRSRRPQLVQCPKPQTYDRPSDSCRPFTIAKCMALETLVKVNH